MYENNEINTRAYSERRSYGWKQL